MTSWFVSRHPGAIAWVKRRALPVDRFVPHLNPAEVRSGDRVYGTLPLELAAEVCQRGARFFALRLTVAERQRGTDLTAEELEALEADFQEYRVLKVEGKDAF
jgi:CRISPR-associated protein Csx16